MDILKTPHQMLLEEAGAKIPTSNGMLKTPQQLLMEETGLPQKFADGGNVQESNPMFGVNAQWLFGQNSAPSYPQYVEQQQRHAEGGSIYKSPEDMIAEIMAQGQTPQHFRKGSTVKNIATQTAWNAPFLEEDAMDIAQDIKNKKYKEAAARTAGVGYSAFTPLNPLTAFISGMTYSPEVGDATLDTYKQRQAEHEAEVSARAKALSPVFKWNKPATLEEMQQEVFGYPNIPLPKVK